MTRADIRRPFFVLDLFLARAAPWALVW